jgi:class 3 adenylate cyclase
MREPCQVFILLETLYGAFDAIAKRRRIFKVETIGDCYVAVAGVPDPRADHAISMCKFATDILFVMRKLTQKMESSLGPDTAELMLRIGLHSGPVTAGVLRGERARFQLFGDTMNTAARMEQTGEKNRIQISQSTADCLHAGGKRYVMSQKKRNVLLLR